MTREEAINQLQDAKDGYEEYLTNEAIDMAISALEQEPTVTSTDEPMTMVYPTIVCEDAISREAVIGEFKDMYKAAERWSQNATEDDIEARADAVMAILMELTLRVEDLPSVTQKSGKCKNCKYFEYDSVAKVDGIPLIVAHEICNKWGGGCKTKEDGYCYLLEPQESEDKE